MEEQSPQSGTPINSKEPVSDLDLLKYFIQFLVDWKFKGDSIDASKITIENCRKSLDLFKK